MATSLLALLDDVASILDDVSLMTKVAAKKTAGVLGDDLALNAQQVAGVKADRELPVVWAVAKGSLVNKAILVPSALTISAFAPWLVTPLLMVGGAFLCYEGFEKLAHRFMHSKDDDAEEHARRTTALTDPVVDVAAMEKDKIKGAVRTDFVLSAEIIAITLGTVSSQSLTTQFVVLTIIALIMTAGVYGVVAGIVKLDDGGLALSKRQGRFAQAVGRAILAGAPLLMKTLSVVGTAAMFLVGGGILVHGAAPLHDAVETLAQSVGIAGGPGGAVRITVQTLLEGLAGVVAGALVLTGVLAVRRVFGRRAAASPA